MKLTIIPTIFLSTIAVLESTNIHFLVIATSFPVHDHVFANGVTSDAVIVSIDPPVEEGVPTGVEIDDKTNVGVLSRIGWQPITIAFSEKPQNLRVELRRFGDDVMSKWTLEDRVLTIRVFCDARAWPNHIYPIHVNWNSGFIALSYVCPG